MANGKYRRGPEPHRVPFNGEMLTYVEVAERTGLSPVRVAALWAEGKPFVRSNPGGPRRALYDGAMLTAREIAARTGMAVSTIRTRMKHGQKLGHIPRAHMGCLVEFDGERLTRAEVARRLGRTKGYVQYRLDRGLPLGTAVKRGRKRKEESELYVSHSLTESGVHPLGSGGEPRWERDADCLFWHLYCGGDGYGECTLEEIGMLWDISRERVRQIAAIALGKIKRAAERGDVDAVNAIEFFRLRSEQRSREPLGYWEQAALNAPGKPRVV